MTFTFQHSLMICGGVVYCNMESYLVLLTEEFSCSRALFWQFYNNL